MIYPPGLNGHLEGTVTTLCRCWRLTRRDGAVSGYTDHDMAVTVEGTLCEPQSGFSASEAKQSLGLQVDSVDIEGALSSTSITDDEIAAGLLDGASVETFLVNWRKPLDYARIGHAVIGKITRSDGRFVAELESRMRSLDQPNGRYVLRRCDAELGDARCKFALGAAHRASGKVTNVQGRTMVTVTGLDAFETDAAKIPWQMKFGFPRTFANSAHHRLHRSAVQANQRAAVLQDDAAA